MVERNLYWGPSWDAPVCENAVQVNTPPWGDKCLLCHEVIVEGDSGTYVGNLTMQGTTMEPVHKECSLRAVLGGIGHHLNHAAHCRLGEGPDAGLTYRQSALLVWELYQPEDEDR